MSTATLYTCWYDFSFLGPLMERSVLTSFLLGCFLLLYFLHWPYPICILSSWNSSKYLVCPPMLSSTVFFFFNTLFIYFIYLFMTVLGLLVFVRGLSPAAASGGHSSSRCGGRSSSRCAGLFTIAAPPVAGHRLQTRRLSSCGSRAQLLRGMWDPPRPGLEPVSPTPAGRLSATVPPGKPSSTVLIASFLALKIFSFISKVKS